jgi:hypothetical protein
MGMKTVAIEAFGRYRYFFNSKAVQDMMDAKTHAALSRAGAFIRRTAQHSMKFNKRGKPSSPGAPPRYHTRGFSLRESIMFSYDPRTQSVVVGPMFRGERTGKVGKLHEFGGTRPPPNFTYAGILWEMRRGGYGPLVIDADGKPITALLWSTRQVARAWLNVHQLEKAKDITLIPTTGQLRSYPARPFMAPALRINLPKIAPQWAQNTRIPT